MSQTRSMLMLAGAALSLGGTAVAEQNAAWSGANADEVRAIVAEMLSDAETRSSLAATGATAGYDKGFFLGSADGNFRLNVSGQIQFRYIIDWRDDTAAVAGNDDFIPGFQNRRTKLAFEGHVFDPNLFYKVQGAFQRTGGAFGGGNFQLEEAYVGYKWDNGFSAQWGQFKLPFLREELVSSKYQLAVDRSFVNEVFNQDYSQGIQATWESEYLRFQGAFSDGFGSRNTDAGPAGGQPADWAFTGRVEWLWSGQWKQFKDFTSQRGSEFAGLLGAAVHYQGNRDVRGGAAAGFPRNKNLLYTADISVEGDGWNLFGAFIGANQDTDPEGAPNFDDFGWVVQGGIYLTDELELFGRYDAILPDSSREAGAAGVVGDRSGNDIAHIITAGVNYYFHGHGAKFTFDTVYAIDNVDTNAFLNPTPGGSVIAPYQAVGTGVGFNGAGGGDNEFIFRAQFQLLF